MTLPSRPWLTVLLLFALAIAALLAIELPAWRSQAAVLRADPETILAAPALRRLALARGAPVYGRYCASCHGAQGKGDANLGVPDLTDAEHLYGEGRVAEIEEIARHGIRSGDKRGWHLASMPVFASKRPYAEEALPALSPMQIEDLTQYLLALTGRATHPDAAVAGGDLFRNYAGCWDCHGHNGNGDPAIGAPSLTDDIWLYGHGSHDDIYRSIAHGRAGVSPAFDRTLRAAQLRDVAVYIASLQPAASRPADP